MLMVVLHLCNSSFLGTLPGLQFAELKNFSQEFTVLWPEHAPAVSVAYLTKKGVSLGREWTSLQRYSLEHYLQDA